MNKIIFATGNEGKMKEIRMILSDLGVEVLSMKEAGISVDIVEDGKTFEHNALIKARTIAKKTNMIAISDDSGLEVDAIGKNLEYTQLGLQGRMLLMKKIDKSYLNL